MYQTGAELWTALHSLMALCRQVKEGLLVGSRAGWFA